jgi:predicted MFS family arabinose efflux permease
MAAATMPLAHARNGAAAFARTLLVGAIGFLTLVDLFAAQAILPTLVAHYGVSRADMGFAVNASTMGMAVAGLLVALVARRIDRKTGIWVALALLAIPTTLLASAPDLATFTWLRIAQGVFMASAFTLTMAHLAEECSAKDAAAALAGYITGGVVSNLVGRLASAGLADHFGLEATFYAFAALNLAGAFVVLLGLGRARPMAPMAAPSRSPFAAWLAHLGHGPLRATFAIGFLILFVFVGTFTYVNFVLVGPTIGLGQMQVGFVYAVFIPSVLTTPFAGRAALRFGTRPTLWASLALAGAGLPLLLVPDLAPVLVGLALLGVGTFFAQAAATGFVASAAAADRAAASGLYLASYYCGGLVGSFVLGRLFDGLGWAACVAAIGAALAFAGLVAVRLRLAAEG